MRITFVRHGQTYDNANRIWQGHGGGGLSPLGQMQAAALGKRLARNQYTRVVSSDVLRVVETSSFLNKPVELDDRFREIDVGSWGGRAIADTFKESPEVFSGGEGGGTLKLGGDGESLIEFKQRVAHNTKAFVEELDHDDDVLVLSHGGFIGNVVSQLFGYAWPSTPTTLTQNTSMTVVEFGTDGVGKLKTFNDSSHLGEDFESPFHGPGHVLTLVRHGQTEANRQERWFGHTCDGLNDWGREQAAGLASWLGPQQVVHSSDSPRAVPTAQGLVSDELVMNDQLRETFMGEWEGLTTHEIKAGWPERFGAIYEQREDLPRGMNGETWAATTARMRKEVGQIADIGTDATVVSHGGAIRSYVLDVLGGGWAQTPAIDFPRNTSVTRIHIGEDRPRLIDYGVGPHLEGWFDEA